MQIFLKLLGQSNFCSITVKNKVGTIVSQSEKSFHKGRLEYYSHKFKKNCKTFF